MLLLLAAAALSPAAEQSSLPDGLYAEIRTSKGRIVARLEPDLTPLTVASFVGLAEGTIANAAFDPGRPFFDGSVYHRVVPGHVIQAGIPQSDRAKNPGYSFPNEIHARLSHNHAGALNMANSGPHTNASQFCITLGDRSYLDGDYTVFGDVVEGMDAVMRIVQGDRIETVRILRVGAKAQAFHSTTESFQALRTAALEQVAAQAEKRRTAEQDWIVSHYPNAAVAQADAAASTAAAPLRVRYRGTAVRYMGNVAGREGPPLDPIAFGSGENGLPGLIDPPQVFTFEPGKTKLNPGLESAIAAIAPGGRRLVVVPAALGYGRAGYYAPEIPHQRRFVISPYTMLVYDVEVLENHP